MCAIKLNGCIVKVAEDVMLSSDLVSISLNLKTLTEMFVIRQVCFTKCNSLHTLFSFSRRPDYSNHSDQSCDLCEPLPEN